MNKLDPSTTNSFDIIRIIEHENSGVHAASLSRMAIGYILSGVKYIYNNDQCFEIGEGSVFIFDTGFHYEENVVAANGRFEQILFYISASSLQKIIFDLNMNYGISFSSRHSCNSCFVNNFASSRCDASLRNFFVGIELALRNSALLHNNVVQRIKLNELIYLILSGEDNCIKRKVVRSVDTSSGQFVNVIYANLFNDLSIERLAELTNRSLTSFKKEFRRLFKTSPHHWIISQRLTHAKIMLSSTSRTVSEIGAECGFSHISHFIKLFKQRYNATPAAYRRESSISENHHSAVG